MDIQKLKNIKVNKDGIRYTIPSYDATTGEKVYEVEQHMCLDDAKREISKLEVQISELSEKKAWLEGLVGKIKKNIL